jgi:hypothetical protein
MIELDLSKLFIKCRWESDCLNNILGPREDKLYDLKTILSFKSKADSRFDGE